ncbi:hypothetical protein MIB92_19670, partial [Aestuariirhabdus sp. Z084]|uniref:hypothetical protein n=1 Tax=Aestuariirhabdus haliotis TaxID=2918751 RepID=UPI00201B4623
IIIHLRSAPEGRSGGALSLLRFFIANKEMKSPAGRNPRSFIKEYWVKNVLYKRIRDQNPYPALSGP